MAKHVEGYALIFCLLNASIPISTLAETLSTKGVGAKPPIGSIILFDGSHGRTAALQDLKSNWKNWPRFNSSSQTAFRIVRDPEFLKDTNRVSLQSCCNSKWGFDDIQATQGIFKDMRIHCEFVGMGEYDKPFDTIKPNANVNEAFDPNSKGYFNSGLYVASRYEIQIKSWFINFKNNPSNHDMGSLVDDYKPLSNQNKKNGQWQALDIIFQDARFKNKAMTCNPLISVWWNGVLVHSYRSLHTGGSGLSNHSGEEFLDTLTYGIKLQSEGRDVRFRNIWVKELKIDSLGANFGY